LSTAAFRVLKFAIQIITRAVSETQITQGLPVLVLSTIIRHSCTAVAVIHAASSMHPVVVCTQLLLQATRWENASSMHPACRICTSNEPSMLQLTLQSQILSLTSSTIQSAEFT
jgi:hypothetical protein